MLTYGEFFSANIEAWHTVDVTHRQITSTAAGINMLYVCYLAPLVSAHTYKLARKRASRP